jgi:nucleotide-binding universal stress UspA family protein
MPVDFSNRCTDMIPYVKLIAAEYNSEIILLHVVNPVYAIPETGISPPAIVPVPKWLIAQQAEKLETFGQAEWQGFRVRRLVYEGEPDAQIAATAQAEGAQFLIIPTHGYGAFRRFLIGSVTAKVLHDVDCPVLTGAHIHEHRPAREMKISNVVCAIDLGPCSCNTLEWASRLSTDFGSALSIIHAVPTLHPSLRLVFSSDVKHQMETMIREEIAALKAKAAEENITVCIEQGEVTHTVCSYARSVGANLLVVGRGGKRNGTGRLRRNAYGIIRQSTCPVLSV